MDVNYYIEYFSEEFYPLNNQSSTVFITLIRVLILATKIRQERIFKKALMDDTHIKTLYEHILSQHDKTVHLPQTKFDRIKFERRRRHVVGFTGM